jgi:two-component system sensor histidine kinase PilS (NtrC family)
MGEAQQGREEATAVRRRLLWVIAARAVVASVLLGTAIVLRVGEDPTGSSVDAHFLLIAATYGLTGLYAASLRYADRHRWLVDVQFAGDILLVSTLVVLSGGVASYFPSLYGLPIVAAGAVQRRRGGLLTAALSAVCYAGVIGGQYSGVPGMDAGAPVLPPWQDAWYRVAMNGAGFLAVGWLTGSLSEGWRTADLRLASASSAIADLQVLTRCIMDSLPGGVLTADERGRVLAANRAAVSITGRGPDELLGATVDRVLQLPHDLGQVAGAGPRKVEFEYMKPSGQRIVLGLGTVPLSGDSHTRGHVFTFQDVTEAKRRDFEAQRQKRLAAIGEMAAGIAHEIRNPLASMTGSMQLLRTELPLSGDQAQLMDIVLRESARLNEIIRNFLAYARPQRRDSRLVDLRRVVEETAALLGNSPERRDTHAVRTVAGPGDTTCEGDEGQLRQVVWNLATNALRAMPHGGTLTFSVAVERAGESGACAVLTVEDTGVGMSAQQQERLFQPFQSGFGQGTGLGLAIAHRIVADHEGAIGVSSEAGKGTTVTVRLPVGRGGQVTVGGWQGPEAAASPREAA